MADDYETRDEFAEEDNEFDCAHAVIMQDLALPAHAEAVEQAARTLATLAIESGDRLKLCCLLARLDDYIQAGRPVPPPMLLAVGQAFTRFRAGASMDEAFFLARPRRGRPESWGVREWARTNAGLVAFWVSRGSTLEAAVGRTADLRGQSDTQVKRDYLRYRRIIKSE